MMSQSGFSFTDWRHPEDTLGLCKHVAQFGPRRWDELTGLISCPVALLALKWHVIRLGRIGAIAKTSKAYSDWELCVLFVAGQPATGAAQLGKKAMLAELSKWLPGRSAEGLRQAYAHNITGSEAKFLAKLTANGWPSDLTALLIGWPGPSPQAQAVLDSEGIEADKAAATALLQELSAWAPLAKQQKLAAAATDAGVPSAVNPAGHMPQISSMWPLGIESSTPLLLPPTQLLQAQLHPVPFGQQQGQGMQLPLTGLDAFGSLPAAAAAAATAAAGGTVAPPDSGLHFLPHLWHGDLAAQIAADLASPSDPSPCFGASSSSNLVGMGVGAAAEAAVSDSALGSLTSRQQLLQLMGGDMEGPGAGVQQCAATGRLTPAASLGADTAATSTYGISDVGGSDAVTVNQLRLLQQQQQQQARGTMLMVDSLAATAAPGTAEVVGGHSAPPVAAASAAVGQLSVQKLCDRVAALRDMVDKQQQLVTSLLTGIKQELVAMLAVIHGETGT